MTITPPKRRRHRPIALLEPGWRSLMVHTEDDSFLAHGPTKCRRLLERLEGFMCYTNGSLTALRHTTGAGQWTAETWRGRATRMTLDGSKTSIVSLRGSLTESKSPFGDLLTAIDWVRGFGVTPSTLSQMAWGLWRASLSQDVEIRFDPQISRAGLFGGRQEIREPKTYAHMVAADISAAYPTAMAALDYALSLREVSPTTFLDPTVPGLARARVTVPQDLPHPPLPVRVGPDVIQWQWGNLRGVWSWCELAAAKVIGADVEVSEAWAPTATADLFGPWWALVAPGRMLPGSAAQVIKGVANSLWGIFGMRGDDTALIRWTDDTGDKSVTVKKTPRALPHRHIAHVAAETSARVRVRLLIEALYGDLQGAVHIDTDGVIVRGSKLAGDLVPAESTPGGWRIKTHMRKVEIRAPQVYRYLCGKGCGITHDRWHYVTAGVPAETARSVFERVGHLGTPLAFRGLDLVLPPGNAAETEKIGQLVSAARAVSGAVYGPPLG